MNKTDFTLTNRHGAALSATIEFPGNRKASHIALFSHCFTCHSNINAVRNISRSLLKNGVAVVRFDFTGLGKSSGNFKDSHFEANIEDIEDVNNYITENYFAPSLIIGHSLGGSAAIVAASILDNIKAVCTIGSPAAIEHTTKHFRDQLDELNTKGETTVQIGGRPFTINQEFVDGFKQHYLPDILKSMHKPILIFHSPVDEIVSIDNAQQLYESARHPKSFVSLDKADHLLNNKEDSLYVGDVIATWVRKYLPKEEITSANPEEHQLVATLNTKEDTYTTSINSDNHGLIADEPSDIGGNNYGMSPYELVSAGLAACTAMTINMYARRKEWNLDEVKVFISHKKEKREEGTIDLFVKELDIEGDLDSDQKNRLIEIAAKCPVHKTLANASVIETKQRN